MAVFGPLEQRVMDALWASSTPLTVTQVRASIEGEREFAYTTVMTVLDRLHKKGRVLRDRAEQASAWRYRAVTTRAEMLALEMHQALNAAGGERNVVLAEFLEGLPEVNLQHLQRLLAAKASMRG